MMVARSLRAVNVARADAIPNLCAIAPTQALQEGRRWAIYEYPYVDGA
jgi:hypothetical protein